MSNFNQTGLKISQYQTAQVNNNELKNKLTLDHFIVSYAPAYFGTGTINKNYKIPIQNLREDILGYIGIENAKGNWRDTVKLWFGEWDSTDKVKSYVYEWDFETERGHNDYISNKHGLNADGSDRLFFLNSAYIPYETPADKNDPCPSSVKFVTKQYIDSRFDGIPKIEVSGTDLELRSYQCVYVFDSMPTEINIIDTLRSEDGQSLYDRLGKNCLMFLIKLPVPNTRATSIQSINFNNGTVSWSYENELSDIVYDSLRNFPIWLKAFGEIIDGVLHLTFSNAINIEPTELFENQGIKQITPVSPISITAKDHTNTDLTISIDTAATLSDDANTVPTTKAVHAHTSDESIHFTEEQINTLVQNKIDSQSHITVEDVTSSLNVSPIKLSGITYSQTDGKGSIEVETSQYDSDKKELTKTTNVITGAAVVDYVDNYVSSKIAEYAELGLSFHVLGDNEDLPTASKNYKGAVYLKKAPADKQEDKNIYIEYICVQVGTTYIWEQIGSTQVDLTDYATKNYVDTRKGIDIGTKDKDFENDDDTTGFLNNVSKINFKGAFVNVIKKDDGTVDLWINPDNNLGKIDAKSSSFAAPSAATSKYVFGGDDYTLPTTTGSSFARCHPVANDPTVTLKGKKDGKVNTPFSIGNISSQIKAVVYDKAGTAKATCTTAVLKSGAATKTENNITITIGSLKEYTEADAEGGVVPGTVSLSCSVTPDISAIFGEGDTWSMKVFLVNGDSEEELYSSDTYYAYTTKVASISSNPSVKVNGTAKIRWVSGVEYIAKDTKFDVTYGTMSNTTYMVAANSTKRGTIALTSCGSADINGSTSDTCSTVISGGTVTLTLGDDTTARDSLTATHTAISVGGNAEKPASYSGKIWSSYTTDDEKNAYFQYEGGTYGRILGHMNSDNSLEIDSDTFDSKQSLNGNTQNPAYNNQAKVYNSTLVYGTGTGEKYYVRKFNKKGSGDKTLSSFILSAPGCSLNDSNTEIWMFATNTLSTGRRLNAGKPVGIGSIDNGKIKIEVDTGVHTIMENGDFYIVVKLKNSNAKITGTLSIS